MRRGGSGGVEWLQGFVMQATNHNNNTTSVLTTAPRHYCCRLVIIHPTVWRAPVLKQSCSGPAVRIQRSSIGPGPSRSSFVLACRHPLTSPAIRFLDSNSSSCHADAAQVTSIPPALQAARHSLSPGTLTARQRRAHPHALFAVPRSLAHHHRHGTTVRAPGLTGAAPPRST